jgi:Ca2+-transporting ATPase
LLWINLVTDGLPALALATNPLGRNLLQQSPRPVDEQMASRSFLGKVAFSGGLIALTALATYIWALSIERNQPDAGAQTYAFSVIVFSQLFCALAFASKSAVFWRLDPWPKVRLLIVIFGTVAFQLLLFQSDIALRFLKIGPLPWHDLLAITAVSIIPVTVLELLKLGRRERQP